MRNTKYLRITSSNNIRIVIHMCMCTRGCHTVVSHRNQPNNELFSLFLITHLANLLINIAFSQAGKNLKQPTLKSISIVIYLALSLFPIGQVFSFIDFMKMNMFALICTVFLLLIIDNWLHLQISKN